jgi:hypothetical protein
MKIFDDIIYILIMSSIAIVIFGTSVIFLIFTYRIFLGKGE